jgi:hypothetical protein
METAGFSKISVTTHKTTWCLDPEYHGVNLHRHVNLKTQKLTFAW